MIRLNPNNKDIASKDDAFNCQNAIVEAERAYDRKQWYPLFIYVCLYVCVDDDQNAWRIQVGIARLHQPCITLCRVVHRPVDASRFLLFFPGGKILLHLDIYTYINT